MAAHGGEPQQASLARGTGRPSAAADRGVYRPETIVIAAAAAAAGLAVGKLIA